MEKQAGDVPGAEAPQAPKAEDTTVVRANSWCFTINNYTDADCAAVEALTAEAVYLVCNKEVGEQGTPHLQGYVKMKSTRTRKSMSKKLPRASLRAADGTAQQNRDYIYKVNDPKQRVEEVWLELGEIPQQGKRTDLQIMREAIAEGANIRELVHRVQGTQAVRSAELLMKYIEQKRNFKTEVMWFYGPDALDNEEAAIAWLGDDYYHTQSLKWFEGYDAHENVLLALDTRMAPSPHQLMGLMGEREYRVENKGSSRQFLARKMAIVAPLAPIDIYPSVYEYKAFERLIAKVEKVDKAAAKIEAENVAFSERLKAEIENIVVDQDGLHTSQNDTPAQDAGCSSASSSESGVDGEASLWGGNIPCNSDCTALEAGGATSASRGSGERVQSVDPVEEDHWTQGVTEDDGSASGSSESRV